MFKVTKEEDKEEYLRLQKNDKKKKCVYGDKRRKQVRVFKVTNEGEDNMSV